MVKLTYIGIDDWDRLVFKGDNNRYYKTTELEPRGGFEALEKEERYKCLKDLHTTSEPDGEPDFPCWKEIMPIMRMPKANK
jgi:hypothetical protein